MKTNKRKIFIEFKNAETRSSTFIYRTVNKNSQVSYYGKLYRVKTYATGDPDLFLMLED